MLKKVFVIFAFFCLMRGISYSAPGDLDVTFGENGMVVYDSELYDGGEDVLIQPDGKIVVLGTSYTPGWEYVIVLRYDSDGSPDTSFGVNGRFVYSPGIAIGEAIALQSDGKIVVAGSRAGSNMDGLLLRLNSNGTLDTTFGINGVVTYDGPPLGGNSDSLGSVAIQSDGKIVAAGHSFYGFVNYDDAVILRYNSNGTLDTTFGTNGAIVYNSAQYSSDNGSVIYADEKILVIINSSMARIFRYNSDGSLDTTFGADGIFESVGSFYAGALQSDGKIVAAGRGGAGGLLLRLNSNGTLDTTFGINGVVTHSGFNSFYALSTQSDGKIVVGGDYYLSPITPYNVLRYDTNGAIDNTFGGDEDVLGGLSSGVRGLVVQVDDNIVALGSIYSMTTDTSEIISLRLIGHEQNIGVSPVSTDFGNVVIGSSSSVQTVTISNKGDLDLNIDTISLTGTDVSEFDMQNELCSGQVLAPLGDCTVQGVFSPTSTGSKSATLTISSDDPDTPALDVPLSGTGVVRKMVLLSPNGGEVLPSGSTYDVQWAAPDMMTKFKLKYSLDNGATWLSAHAGKNYVKSTSYNWTVPTPLNNQKKCLMKVEGFDSHGAKLGSDKSDSTFTIEVVKLTYPDLPETFASGDLVAITWETNATKHRVAKVKLFYTKNGGMTWKEIDPTVWKTDTGSYDWRVPTMITTKTKCKVKIVLEAGRETLGSDVSDSFFTIQPAP